jgi:guanylate kinase
MDIIDKKRYTGERGRVFLLSGPSGTGKDTVFNHMLTLQPALGNVEKCVTATTRSPNREHGEKPQQTYLFLSRSEFLDRVIDGYFLEYAEYAHHLYGTPVSGVMDKVNAGVDVFLIIEVQGAAIVKRKLRDAIMIFLIPPSISALEKRLRLRSRDTSEAIRKRLESAIIEMKAIPSYDYLLVNDSVEQAANELRSIIVAERSRIRVGHTAEWINDISCG